MSAASIAREVAACRAWERRLAEGSPQTRLHAAMPRAFERLLPLAMPVYGAIALEAGVKWDSEWWVYFLPWWWLLSRGRAFPRVLPTEWEALALPSRRAWLLGRLSLRVPILAWLGACTIAGLLLRGLRDVPDPEGLRWGVIVALALAPALLAAVSAWHPLAERQFGTGMAHVAALAAVGGAASAIVGAILCVAAPADEMSVAGMILLGLGFVFAALAAPSFFRMVRGPAGGPSRLGTAIWIGFVGSLSVATIAGLVFATLMWPHGVLVPEGGARPAAAGVWLPLLVAAALIVTALDLWHRVEVAEVGLVPTTGTAARAKPVAPPKSRPAARGGSLLAASWALYRARWRIAPLPLLTFLPRLIWHLRAPIAGAAAACVCVTAVKVLWFAIPVLWFAGLLLVIGVPFHLDLPESRRLHLLGADWAPLARHNLRWGVALSVLPATAGACAAMLLPFGTPAAWAGAIAMVAGFTAIRTCVWSLDPIFDALPDGQAARLTPLGAVAATAFGYMYLPEPTHLVLAAAVFAVGAAGLVREWRDPEAAGRRLEGAASDD